MVSSASLPPLTVQRRPHQNQSCVEPLELAAGDLPLRLMLIPAGEFMMGSPEDEEERKVREGPQHRVVVPSFLLGQYPVTQAQWRAVAAMPQQERELQSDPSRFKGTNRPVENISWGDATEFCARLAAQTQRDYRLPSEAEWEYACRAGTTTPFFFGETLVPKLANYACSETYGLRGVKGKWLQETTVVDHYGVANQWGLVDMHGNVWEWCQDDFHDSYNGAPSDGSTWLDKTTSITNKVVKGGSWYDLPRYCRSAYRNGTWCDDSNDSLGFRVACPASRTLAL